MKMVKSLLLGSAAGLVAVTAGQAADLPVKVKPVEYVKVCTLYGAGFYYMPGTDMCIKIGGWVRAEATWGGNGNFAFGPFNANLNQRQTNNLMFRARGYITADAREQTAYGVARAYIAVGLSTTDFGFQVPSAVDSVNRAFVQWAGITAGLSQSFYDFYAAAAHLYRAGYIPSSDTGDGGWWVWAYTAQLGNGVGATISAEARRTTQIIDQSAVGTAAGAAANVNGFTNSIVTGGAFPANGGQYGGQQAPDIVGNLRVDQAWGGAQIMGALHQVDALYYGVNPTTAGLPAQGHPGDKWGFAAGAGFRLNTPSIAQGDYFDSQVNYTQGALRYLFAGENNNFQDNVDNSQVFGVMSDCVYGGLVKAATGPATQATACELTTAWGFNASFEHYWTPQLHQSVAGGYTKVEYDTLANAMLCSGVATITGKAQGTGVGTAAVATAGCNNNWSYWGVGTRLQYNVTKNFYLGVEALYNRMDGGSTSDNLIHGFTLAGAPVGSVSNQRDNWSFTARIHKDFLP
jgi:hypothetical protein